MCGIAGIHRIGDARVEKLNTLADKLLLAIEHRGTDATGFATITDRGLLTVDKRTVPASRYVRDRKAASESARTMLLHTRFATRGAADDPRNAHPIRFGDVVAVHNGTVYNDRALFKQAGLTPACDVDSEVIPALIHRYGWEKAHRSLGKLRGGAATAIIAADRPGELILARTSGYSLHIYATDELIVWASEPRAIRLAMAATYGWWPGLDMIVTLGEYMMVSVNGKATVKPIERDPEWSKPSWTWPQGGARQKASSRKQKSGKGKGRGKRGSAAGAVPAASTAPVTAGTGTQTVMPLGEQSYEQDAVRDLMRWTSMSRAEAEEAVYGYTLSDDNWTFNDRDEIDWGL